VDGCNKDFIYEFDNYLRIPQNVSDLNSIAVQMDVVVHQNAICQDAHTKYEHENQILMNMKFTVPR